jgi:hypothetical protein
MIPLRFFVFLFFALPAAPQQQAQDPELQNARGRAPVSTAALTVGEKKITIRYQPQPANETSPLPRLARMKDGEVVALDRQAALRLRTETELRFGDAAIKTDIHAPGYPGVYSIWLRKRGPGWSLVFNTLPDIWGTQHDARNDITEVPLVWKALDEPAKRLAIDLRQEEGSTARLRIAWGANEWTALFSVVGK